MTILVLNTGSSTLKFAWYDEKTLKAEKSGSISLKEKGTTIRDAVRDVIGERSSPPSIIGHRIVHGGTQFRSSVIIDADVKRKLQELSKLAPLHNPPALEAVKIVDELLPKTPHVGVFDTAFFGDLSPKEFLYPVPYEWYANWGIRRFGFHGISHDYCFQRATEMLGKPRSKTNVIVCHLGNGCSATAIQDGKPVATTMGFTPLEGMMMGTRSGSIDPGILLFLEKEKGWKTADLDEALNHQSGLLGVSGLSGDFREIEREARNGHERSKFAFDMYADRVGWAIAGLSTKLGVLDALVFTAGVGENSAALRTHVVDRLGLLGVYLDPKRNETCAPDQDIASSDSRARVLVIHTDEERMIAQEAKQKVSAKQEAKL